MLRRRISSYLSAVLAVSLLSTVAVTLDASVTTTPAAAAETFGSQTFNYTGGISQWTPPAGTSRMRLILYGAGGGHGGLDCGRGCWHTPPSNVGYVVTDWFTPVSRLDIGVGGAGGWGASSARGWGGGSGGYSPYGYHGGRGGDAGLYGSSGGGGGGGAATVVNLIGGPYPGLLIAGGGGGGGGNGNFGYTSAMVGQSWNSSNGAAVGNQGGWPGWADGGGGGGGGGGRWAGNGGWVYRPYGSEWAGVGGYVGSNGRTMNIPIATSTFVGWGSSHGQVVVQWYQASVPSAPTNARITSVGSQTVNVAWSAPSDPGGPGVAINRYQLVARSSGVSDITCATTNGSTFTASCTSLQNSRSYTFLVRAENLRGWGSDATAGTATPFTVPSQMSAPTVTEGNGSLSVAWTPPDNNGSIINNYTIQIATAATSTRSWSTLGNYTGTSANITGLSNGTPYVLRIWANNAAGAGVASVESSSRTPRTSPSAPLSLTATSVANQQVNLSWQPPASNGGVALTDYIVEFDSGTGRYSVFNDGSGTGTTASVTSLTNGTSYTFRVKARNSANLESSYSNVIIATPVTVPSAPTSVNTTWPSCAAECSGRLVVNWVPPTNNGGTSLTEHIVQVAIKPGVSESPVWSTAATVGGSDTTVTLAGLTDGTTYIVRVAARNSVGISSYVEESTGKAPRRLAGRPGNVQALQTSNQQVNLTWTTPASDGGSPITGYRIEFLPAGSTTWQLFTQASDTSTTRTVTGLTNGVSYQFRVSAITAAGTGLTSDPSSDAVPMTTPATAVITNSSAGNETISVTVGSFDTGGATISSIQYSLDNGSSWQNSGVTSGSFSVSGLTNGNTYQVRIRAVNIRGTGPASSAISLKPMTTPGQPLFLQAAQQSNQRILLTWVAPTSNGGSPITDYIVSYRETPTASSWITFNDGVSSLPRAEVTGLTNGKTYEFRVTAVNAAGTSTSFSVTAEGTPRTFASAPNLFAITPGNTELFVRWDPPTDNGGTAVTGYNVFFTTGSTTRSVFASDTQTTITGLVNGTSYTVTVRALTGGGQGAASNSQIGTPAFTPSAPQAFVVAESVSSLSLSWGAPSSNGGSAITSYQVETSTNGTDWSIHTSGISASARSLVITGLTPKQPYFVRISARNLVGLGAAAQFTNSVIPYGRPTQPTIIDESTKAYPGKVDVVFNTLTADSNGATITGYKVYTFLASDTSTVNRNCTTSQSGPAVTCTVSGLTNKVTYIFAVVAINAAGESQILTYSAPRRPGSDTQTITATPISGLKFGDAARSINATASSGLPVRYSEQTPNVCTLVGATAQEKESLGLVFPKAAGTCVIRITQGGDSTFEPAPTVDLSFSIAAIAPSAPIIRSAQGTASKNLVITWDSPTSTGGTPLTAYVVRVTGQADVVLADTSTRTYTFSNLNPDSYSVQIGAQNAVGTTYSSAVSARVFTAPDSPTAVTVTTGDKSLTVSWTRGNEYGLSTTGIRADASTSADFASFTSCSTLSNSCTITGLNQDQQYYVRVFQSNAFLTSETSAVVTQSTGQLAQSVSSVTLRDSSSSIVSPTVPDSYTVNFPSGPLQIGATLSSAITPSISSASAGVCSYNSVSGRITLLSAGTCLIEIGQSGSGNAFAPMDTKTITIIINSVAPTAPILRSVSPTGTSGELLLTWSAPSSNGGSSLTGHSVAGATGGTVVILSETQAVVQGLNFGSYSFSVAAINSAGTSPQSNAVTYNLLTKPGAPQNLSVSTANSALLVEFDTSTSTGGTAITAYRATASDGTLTKSCTVTEITAPRLSCLITGLINDSTYTVSVVADNGFFTSDSTSVAGAVAGNIAQRLNTWSLSTLSDSPVAISADSAATVSFTEGAVRLSTTLSSGLAPTVSITSGSCSYESGTSRISFTTAGPCVVSISQSGVGNAFAAMATETLTVNVLAVAPSAPSVAKVFMRVIGFDTATANGTLEVNLNRSSNLGGATAETYSLLVSGVTGGTTSCTSLICTVSGTWSDLSGQDSFTTTIAVTAQVNTSWGTVSAASQNFIIYRPDPGAPQNASVTASVSDTGVIGSTITWQPPISAGNVGSFIDTYTVTIFDSSNTEVVSIPVEVDSATVTVTFTETYAGPLSAGQTYRAAVTATNNESLSRSTGLSFQTPSAPSAVQGLTVLAGDASATLSWQTPLNNGGDTITSYVITRSNNTSVTVQSTTLNSISGLTNGVVETVTVRAQNRVGLSSPEQITVKPYGVPTAPDTVAVTTNIDSATVTWQPGSDNGSAITSYRVSIGNNVASCLVPGFTTTCSFASLNPGTYEATVIAVNARGDSSPRTSSSFTIVPLDNPITFETDTSRVTSTSMTVNYGSGNINLFARSTSGASVIFATTPAPSNVCEVSAAGVVTIKSYVANSSPQTCVITATTTEPTGSKYKSGAGTFTITINAIPTSAPTGLTASIDNGVVTLSWQAPEELGGGSVDSYTVTQTSTSGSTDIAVSGATNLNIIGLDAGTSYSFSVKANNSSPNSASSTTNVSENVTILAVPTAPSNIVSDTTSVSAGQVRLTWDSSTGTVDRYRVSLSGPISSTIYTADTTTVVSGLPIGTYSVSVAAENSRGLGTAATSSISVGLVQTITLRDGNGVAVSGYTIGYDSPTTRILATSSVGAPLTYSLTGASATYCTLVGDNLSVKRFSTSTTSVTCEVVITAAGTSTHLSATETALVTINLSKPDAPASVTLIPGDQQVVVSWEAPPSNGGSNLTGYRVYYTKNFSGSGETRTPIFVETVTAGSGMIPTNANSLTTTITGLLNGYTYAVKVSAVNAVGEGELDPEAVPAGAPGQVESTSVVTSDRLFTVSWIAPQDTVTADGVIFGNGGSPITGFEVIVRSDVNPSDSFTATILPTADSRTVYTVSIPVPLNKIAYSVSVVTVTGADSSTTNLGSFTPVATQSITVSAPTTSSISMAYGTTYQITASASSGLNITYTSSASDICSVSASGLITGLKVGTCEITIAQPGNDVFNAATTETRTVTVSAIVAPDTPTVAQIGTDKATVSSILSWGGSDMTAVFEVCTTTGTITCTNVGAGTVNNTSTGTLSQQLTDLVPSTTYSVRLVATPAVGTAETSAATIFTTLKVPLILTEITTFDALSSVSIQLEADSSTGTGRFSEWEISSGSLPSGLTLDTNTAVISGTVTTPGPFASAKSETFTVRVTDSLGNEGSRTYPVLVRGASQNLSFAPISNRPYSTATLATILSKLESATVTYASSNTNICTIDTAGVITLVRDGVCTVTASSPAFDSYREDSATVTFTVSKASQTISFGPAPTPSYSDAGTFTVNASASSGLAVAYSSTTLTVCTVNSVSGVVTILSAGSCNIRAEQIPTGDFANRFESATAVDLPVTIAKAAPTIVMTSPATIGYQESFTVTANITGGGALSITSGNNDSLTATGTRIEAKTGSGVVPITLTADTSTNYTSGSVTFNITLTRAAQSINPYTLNDVTYSPDSTVALSATSTSNLPVAYQSGDNSLAEVSGSTLTIKGAGTVTLTLSQSGDANQYLPAPETTTTLTILKAPQVITSDSFPTTATFGDSDTAIGAFNKSGGVNNGRPVALEPLTLDVCTLINETNTTLLRIVGVGTCSIKGSNAGDANYLPAAETFTVTVAKATRTLNLNTLNLFDTPTTTITFGVEQIKLTAQASEDDLDEKIFAVSGPCTLSSDIITSTGAGTCEVTATVNAGARYQSAVDTATITILKSPQSITNVIRGTTLTPIRAPQRPDSVTSYSIASVQVQVGDTVVAGASPESSTVVVWIEHVMSDSSVAQIPDTFVATTVSGRIVSVIDSLTTGVVADQTLAVVESDRTTNAVLSVLTPVLPTGADSFVVLSLAAIGKVIEVGDSVAVLSAIDSQSAVIDTVTVTAEAAGIVLTRADTSTSLPAGATLATLTPALKINEKLALKATKGPGTSPLTYTSLDPSKCSVSADAYGTQRVLGIARGECVIRIDQATDANYLAASDTQTILIARGDQKVEVEVPTGLRFAAEPAPLVVVTARGAEVEFVSADTGLAVIEDGKVVPKGVGQVAIEIKVSGTEDFNPVPTIYQNVEIDLGIQVIDVVAPTSGTAGQEVSFTTKANSGLEVEVVSLTPPTCIVSDSRILLLTAGECRITGLQLGSNLWDEATPVFRTIAVAAGGNSFVSNGLREKAEGDAERANQILQRREAVQAAAEAAKRRADEQAAAQERQVLERLNRVEVRDPVVVKNSTTFPSATTSNPILLIDGVSNFITKNVVNQNRIVISGAGLQMSVSASPDRTSVRTVRPDGSLRVVERDYLLLQGSGLRPNTKIRVWGFSKATYVGEFDVDAKGSYNSRVRLPQTIKKGEHRLQINGVMLDGRVNSFTLGLRVEAPSKAAQAKLSVPKKKSVKAILFKDQKPKLSAAAKRLISINKPLVKPDAQVSCIAYRTKAKLTQSERRVHLQRAERVCEFLIPADPMRYQVLLRPLSKAENVTPRPPAGLPRVDILITRD